MSITRNVARELLPLVVLAWATFAILYGAPERIEGSVVDEGHADMSVTGLCVLGTVLVLATRSARFIRPSLTALFTEPAWSVDRSISLCRPAAYARPPSNAPSLQRLQRLRI
jgi:hypothetical protein